MMLQELCQGAAASDSSNERTRTAHRTCRRDRKARRHFAAHARQRTGRRGDWRHRRSNA
jgi:hypothetical protein